MMMAVRPASSRSVAVTRRDSVAGIEPARRLVEDDEARIGEQQAGERQQLALAGRELGVAGEVLVEAVLERTEPVAQAHGGERVDQLRRRWRRGCRTR